MINLEEMGRFSLFIQGRFPFWYDIFRKGTEYQSTGGILKDEAIKILQEFYSHGNIKG